MSKKREKATAAGITLATYGLSPSAVSGVPVPWVILGKRERKEGLRIMTASKYNVSWAQCEPVTQVSTDRRRKRTKAKVLPALHSELMAKVNNVVRPCLMIKSKNKK